MKDTIRQQQEWLHKLGYSLDAMVGVQTYNITPVPKPRMTQRDKWKKRKSVENYWAFKDAVRQVGVFLPTHGAQVIFVIPMPGSWSKKKQEIHHSQPHQQQPDTSNLLKSLEDAVYDEDSHIWDIQATKIWGYRGQIIIAKGDNDAQ